MSAKIGLASIDTGYEQRDAHLRSAEFLDVEIHPTMSFRSTGVRPASIASTAAEYVMRSRGYVDQPMLPPIRTRRH